MSGITFVEPISVNTAATFTFANTSVTSTIAAGSLKTDTILYANGSPYQFVTVAGANTQIQFNNGNGFGASSNLTFNSTTSTLSVPNITSSGTLNFTTAANVALGNISNVRITGGNSGQLLTTDGNGTLSWTTVSTTGITSGNSNVSIPAANGNVTIGVGGTANVIVVTSTGVNISGTLNTANSVITAGTGNITAGNGNLGNLVTANFFSGNGSLLTSINGANITGTSANSNYSLYAGTVLTNAQPNITSVGNLVNLTVTGNILATNLNSVSNNGANFNIVGATQNTSNGLGGSISVTAGEGNGTGRGGLISLNAGNASLTGNAGGGNITLTAGYGYGLGQGGQVGIYAGPSGNANGGQGSNIVFTGGNFGGAGGSMVLTSGTAGGTDKDGGSITIAAGAGRGAGTPGSIILRAANVATTGNTVQTSANVLVITGNGGDLTGALAVSGNVTAGNIVGRFANGNSSINIPAANGNAVVSIGGTSNVLVVTTTGLNVIGNGNITLSGAASQISGANLVSASHLAGTLTTASQTNITSVGTLSSLTVGPNSSISLSGTSGYVRANSIFGLDGTAAIYPYYGNTAGAVGVVTDLTVGAAGTGNLTVNGNISGTITTAAQTNITSIGVLSNLRSNGTVNFTTASNVSLGNVSNVKITGGSSGQYLTTDGAGNLSFAAISGSSITNGTSNVNIPTANGNINLSAAGNANILVVTGTGVSVAGTLNATGNTTLGNLVTANFFTGTLTTAAQPNITSIGTLGNLTSNGTINFTGASNVSLGAVGNVRITGGNSGQYLQTNGSGGLSWAGITTTAIVNGNSNVSIGSAGGNVTVGVGGTANVVVFDPSGMTVAGATGNITGANVVFANLFTGNLSGASSVSTVNLNITGLTVIAESQETFGAVTGATGVVGYDYSVAGTYFHTNVAGNFTANIVNLPTIHGRASILTLVIAQGTTAYLCNAVQIAGVAQTIRWYAGTIPTATSNRVEAIVFTIFNNTGTYTVLGQLASYG